MMETDGSKKAIAQTIQEASEAYVARDWDGFTSFFMPDAVWMPPDMPPLVGKEAWWEMMKGGWHETVIEKHITGSVEIVVAGDWAYEWHKETQIGPDWEMRFKGIFILRRQRDGSWKIARYCFNMSPMVEE